MSDWRDGEQLAQWHMRTRLGFADALVTPPGVDAGIDVVATGAAAQVKHYADKPVGAPEVQQARGAAYSVESLLFYALSGYTDTALKAAANSGVCLFKYTIYGDVTAVNVEAKRLLAIAQNAREEQAERARTTVDKPVVRVRTPAEVAVARAAQYAAMDEVLVERGKRRERRATLLAKNGPVPEKRSAARLEWDAAVRERARDGHLEAGRGRTAQVAARVEIYAEEAAVAERERRRRAARLAEIGPAPERGSAARLEWDAALLERAREAPRKVAPPK